MKSLVRFVKGSPVILSLVTVTALLAGCTATGPAPVRDSDGVQSVSPSAEQTQQMTRTHTVKPGETLSSIARQHELGIRDLIIWNRLTNPDQIYVGQQLWLSEPLASADSGAVAIPILTDNDGGTKGKQATAVPLEETVQVVRAPLGGKQPFSEESWAKSMPPGATTSDPETTTPIRPTTVWIWPVKGEMLADFNQTRNKGIDLAGKPGEPVLAAASGKVAYSGSALPGYGKLVIIRHGGEFLTAYGHNQTILVEIDQVVRQGQKIAELGSTDSDRPKLHFQLRKQGHPVDPLKYLPARKGG